MAKWRAGRSNNAPALGGRACSPRYCRQTRASRDCAPPYAAHEFAVHPHENFELALGFLDFEQRVQLQPRQAVALGFAGECRRPRRVAVVTVASGEPSLPVIQAQLGMALASLRPPRPNPAPGAGAVSGVRLSAASAQPAAAVESPPVGEGFQVMPGTSFARCRPGAAQVPRTTCTCYPAYGAPGRLSTAFVVSPWEVPVPSREGRFCPARADIMPPSNTRSGLRGCLVRGVRRGDARHGVNRQPWALAVGRSPCVPFHQLAKRSGAISGVSGAGCERLKASAPSAPRSPLIPGISGQDLFSLPRQALTIGSVGS